eukprot:COSAG02_NODE_5583_length_4212_cov_2.972296_4_plen_92_part_00
MIDADANRSPWEGGVRVAAFVSGGALPVAVRGTNQTVRNKKDIVKSGLSGHWLLVLGRKELRGSAKLSEMPTHTWIVKTVQYVETGYHSWL